tara:strand:- start:8331 stop:8753 length:423 start_codon:yes stop_codon:yes gene_type:complete
MQEQRNEHDKIKGQMQSLMETSNNQTSQLFQDTQWLYGWATEQVVGFAAPDGLMYKALADYRNSATQELTPLSVANRWVLLCYPMQEVDDGQGSTHVLMKMRTVDSDTGQLRLNWAVVATRTVDGLTRSIGEFSVAPYEK